MGDTLLRWVMTYPFREKQMYSLMKDSVGRDRDGFKQRKKDIENQSFWSVRDFESVHQTLIRYSEPRLSITLSKDELN